MNGRQIEAELQHNFNLLACSLPNYWTDLHKNFTFTVALLNHAYTRRYPIPFLNARAMKARSLPFFNKIGCHGNIP